MLCAEAVRPSWITPIVEFLTKGTTASDPAASRKMHTKAARYVYHKGVLYKKCFSHQPLLRCLDPYEGNYVLREIHEGICGQHLGGRALAMKAMRQGSYWPTMRKDADDLVKRCDRCQRFAPLPRLPAETLNPITSPWPFVTWGIDILGPFPMAAAQKRCEGLSIKLVNTSVAHPQANGQVEACNKILARALKKKVKKAKGRLYCLEVNARELKEPGLTLPQEGS